MGCDLSASGYGDNVLHVFNFVPTVSARSNQVFYSYVNVTHNRKDTV